MTANGKLVLKWTTAIAIVGIIGAVTTTFYKELDNAYSYTDSKVIELKNDVTRRLERVEDKTDKILQIVSKDR